jgi:GDP-D-mannose dehydratase
VDQNGIVRVKVNIENFRLTEVEHLEANYEKVKRCLSWEPEIGFCELVQDMMTSEITKKT